MSHGFVIRSFSPRSLTVTVSCNLLHVHKRVVRLSQCRYRQYNHGSFPAGTHPFVAARKATFLIFICVAAGHFYSSSLEYSTSKMVRESKRILTLCEVLRFRHDNCGLYVRDLRPAFSTSSSSYLPWNERGMDAYVYFQRIPSPLVFKVTNQYNGCTCSCTCMSLSSITAKQDLIQ